MKLLARLFALFILLPAFELALLVQVDKLIGFWPTIGLILATGLIGSFLARREGLSAWRRLNEQMARGGLPGKELIDGVIILLSGALLVTPGVLTDVVGFLGLIPLSRALIRKYVMARFGKAVKRGSISVGFRGGWTRPTGTESPSADTARWQGTARDQPRYNNEDGGEEGL